MNQSEAVAYLMWVIGVSFGIDRNRWTTLSYFLYQFLDLVILEYLMIEGRIQWSTRIFGLIWVARILGMVMLHIGLEESKTIWKISVKGSEMAALKFRKCTLWFEYGLSQDTCSFQPVSLPNVQVFAYSSYTLMSASPIFPVVAKYCK